MSIINIFSFVPGNVYLNSYQVLRPSTYKVFGMMSEIFPSRTSDTFLTPTGVLDNTNPVALSCQNNIGPFKVKYLQRHDEQIYQTKSPALGSTSDDGTDAAKSTGQQLDGEHRGIREHAVKHLHVKTVQ